jgi:hypothetical protein
VCEREKTKAAFEKDRKCHGLSKYFFIPLASTTYTTASIPHVLRMPPIRKQHIKATITDLEEGS